MNINEACTPLKVGNSDFLWNKRRKISHSRGQTDDSRADHVVDDLHYYYVSRFCNHQISIGIFKVLKVKK